MAGYYGSADTCPNCGGQLQNARRYAYGFYGQPNRIPSNFAGWVPEAYAQPGYGGPMTMGGTYAGNQGQAGGYNYLGGATPSDDEILQLVYDSLDADSSLPYDSDISVDVTAGIVTLTGTVPNKRIKHSAGDDVWWVPGVWDVNNNLKTQRASRQAESRSRESRQTQPNSSVQPAQQALPQASQTASQPAFRETTRRSGRAQSAGRPYGQY